VDLRMRCSSCSVARLTAWVPWLCVPPTHIGLPLSTSAACRQGQPPPGRESVYITRSADPGPVNRLFRLDRAMCLLTRPRSLAYQLPSVPSLIPRSRATRAIGLPGLPDDLQSPLTKHLVELPSFLRHDYSS
jgi:hypothetical protein